MKISQYQMAQQVGQNLKGYTEADEDEIQGLMVADGYPLEAARAFAYGCLSSLQKPPTDEEKAELDELKSKFEPSECKEICLEALKSVQMLRSAKEMLSKVKTSIIDSGASPEAADAFINGFMIKGRK